jgi:polar amino acid transport system substrate-binding protein
MIARAMIAAFIFIGGVQPCPAAETLPLSTGEWKPYTSAEMGGYGFFSEIVAATFKEARIEISIDFYPWKRCEANVKNGKAFAAFPYSITRKRKRFSYFSDSVSTSTTVLFYNNQLHKTSIHFDSMEALRSYSIIGVLGYFYAEKFKEESIPVHYVPTEEKALELIFFKRYDLLPLNKYVGINLIDEKFPDKRHCFSFCKTPLSTNTLHLMVSKRFPNSKELIQKFNAALIRLKEQGKYQKIVDRRVPELSDWGVKQVD